MKRIIIISVLWIALALPTAFGQAPISFTINGSINDVGEPAKVIFLYQGIDGRVSDTVALNNGIFSYKGRAPKPDQAMISVLKESDNPMMMLAMDYDGSVLGRDAQVVYLDEGIIEITGKDLKTARVIGSESHNDYLVLRKALKPIHENMKKIRDKIAGLGPNDDEKRESVMEELMALFKETEPVETAFIKANLNSFVAWNMMVNRSVIDRPEEFKDILDMFPEKLRNSEEGMKLQERIGIAFRTAIGRQAPDFTQNNAEGKPISLRSLRGKYVLVDFWASWCGPCRAENPNVVKVYNTYKDKNFEILGVSLDEDRKAWLGAIEKDKLTWLHVSDLKGWQNEVAILYNVEAVPQNWLVDPNGIIIAKNMKGEELREKLLELIK